MASPGAPQPGSEERHSPKPGVNKLQRVEEPRLVPPASQQNPSIGEQRCRVPPSREHGLRQAPPLILIRIVNLDHADSTGLIPPARGENAAIGERRAAMLGARHSHRPCRAPPPFRVVNLNGAGNCTLGNAAGHQDLAVAKRSQTGLLARLLQRLACLERDPRNRRFVLRPSGGAPPCHSQAEPNEFSRHP